MNTRQLVNIFSISILILLAGVSCSSNSSVTSGNVPIITSVSAEHTNVYPLGNTRIICVATDPDSDTLTYLWAANDGKIIGSGPEITWEAPKSYGDFHIMATVDDGHGNTVSKVVTVTVIVRDASSCCK